MIYATRMLLFSLVIMSAWVPLHAMDFSVRKKIEAERRDLMLSLSQYSVSAAEESEIRKQYNNRIVTIIRDAGDLVSDQERVKHFYYHAGFNDLKAMVKTMVDIFHVKIDAIELGGDRLLEEAAYYDDESFFHYLLDRGAKPGLKMRGGMISEKVLVQKLRMAKRYAYWRDCHKKCS